MPLLSKPRHEQFAQNVARGETLTNSYILAGYPEKAAATCASRLAKQRAVAARIDEIRATISAGLEKLTIRDQARRFQRANERYDKLHEVIAARAADPDHQRAPGGNTGILARKLKQIGSGDSAQLVEEFEVDTGLLTEARKLEEHAAKELGQWTGDGKAGGTEVNVRFAIAFPQVSPEAAAAMQAQVIEADLTTQQRRLLSRPGDGKPL